MKASAVPQTIRTKDLKNPIFQAWNSAKNVICNVVFALAVRTVAAAHLTKAVLGDWKRCAVLTCTVAATAASLSSPLPSRADVGPITDAPYVLYGVNNDGWTTGALCGAYYNINSGDLDIMHLTAFPPNPDYQNKYYGNVGISNNGKVAGVYTTDANTWSGFIYDTTIHEYVSLGCPYFIPSDSGTFFLYAINGSGLAVGGYYNQSSSPWYYSGLVYNNGAWSVLNCPLAPPLPTMDPSCTLLSLDQVRNTILTGVNDLGQIVGYELDCVSYGSSTGANCPNNYWTQYGFVYSDGVWSPINYGVAHTIQTSPAGINNKGQVVGWESWWSDDGSYVQPGFVYDQGTLTTFSVPGATLTYPTGINDKGQIVGHYVPTNGNDSGFVTSAITTVSPLAKNCGCPDCDCPSASVGNPINTATGNKYEVETDFMGGPSTQLSFTRYYNSQDTLSSALGANWHSTYHRGLIVSGASKTSVVRADGRVDTFTLNGSTWVSDPDVKSKLTAIMNGSTQTGWKLVMADDSTENYLLDGRLTSIVTRAGLATALAYNANNQLSNVTGPFGHALSFTYDSFNRVSQVTTPDGILAYTYGTNNNLASVSYPTGTTRQYVYENTTYPHALTGIIDEKGVRFATFAYDANGRGILTEHANGAELTAVAYGTNSSTVTDARGNTRTYTFMTQFDLTKPTAISNAGCSSCGGKAYTYDANGFVASKTDFDGNVTTYVRDVRGLELSRTEASGTPLARSITTTWHTTFHLPTQIVEPDRTTTLTYDTKGNLLQKSITANTQTRTWAYTYNQYGQVTSIEGPRTDVEDVTSYAYDAKGDLATITNALGHVTSVSYDGAGRPLTVTDPNGLITSLAYDKRGRIIRRTAGVEVTGYVRNAVGNLIRIIRPNGSHLAFTYDDAHRLTGVKDMLGNHITYTLDGMGNRTNEQVFDPKNVLAQTRAHEYDALNRLSKDVGAQSQATAYGYDDVGNLTGVADPLGHNTTFAYDALNRP